MGLLNIESLLRVPSLLSINPTSVAPGTTWPYGGTGLGLVKDMAAHPGVSVELLRTEEYGNEVIDAVSLGENWSFVATLRSFDPDAVASVFSADRAGATSGSIGLFYPGATYRAGTLLSGAAVKLLVSPLDTDSYPMLIFYNAIPRVEESAQLDFRLDLENVIATIFYATRDGSGRVMAMERKEDLQL